MNPLLFAFQAEIDRIAQRRFAEKTARLRIGGSRVMRRARVQGLPKPPKPHQANTPLTVLNRVR